MFSHINKAKSLAEIFVLTVVVLQCINLKNLAIADNNPLGDLAKSFMNFSNVQSGFEKLIQTPQKLLTDPQKLLTDSQKLLTSPLLAPGKLLDNPLLDASKLLNPTKIIETPSKVVVGAVEAGQNLTEKAVKSAGGAALDSAVDMTKRIAGGPASIAEALGILVGPHKEKESEFYDMTPPEFLRDVEPLRKPKYFSRDCEFRMACELGRRLKLMAIKPVAEAIKTNKLIHDLQNRYTRATTYGMLYDNCDRYYCVLLQLMGKPKEVASGMVELVNRLANPEMY